MGTVLHDTTDRAVNNMMPVVADDDVVVDTAPQYEQQRHSTQCACGIDAAAPEIIDVVAQDKECAVVSVETASSTVHIRGDILAITVRPGKAC